ncbi:PAS domain-containing protein [Phenylobacterium soli]|uniref:PAS domain-containing protein n=1 Tax=Phenylobacterium soli TaxID=2170551 RepID=A0A328AKY9_9CAUL|nr:hypothetical protein [Phenylobacterium soli]RAK54064.1 hypothetical protein DJ017_05765 [Phenylobacterium soli]
MSSITAAPAKTLKHPYALPGHLSPELARVHAYWRGLLRGAAEMPFWDDAKLTDLPDLADRLFLIDVLSPPERFRFASLGKALTAEELAGRFLDEIRPASPFAFLASQAAATTESAQPTYFRAESEPTADLGGYARLLLPMWGEGKISMILGAVDFG